MEEMRWILLIMGGLLVLGIYLFGVWNKSNIFSKNEVKERIDPTVTEYIAVQDSPDEEIKENEPMINAHDLTLDPTYKEIESEKKFVVTIRLVAINNSNYAGDDLVLALREHGLQLGSYGIFHYYKNTSKNIIFSAASLVEPGIFDLKKIKDQKIPGITFFMSLPLPVKGIEAFDEMLSVVKRLSNHLKGELLDESGSSFSIQRQRYIREQVIEYLFHIKKEKPD